MLMVRCGNMLAVVNAELPKILQPREDFTSQFWMPIFSGIEMKAMK